MEESKVYYYYISFLQFFSYCYHCHFLHYFPLLYLVHSSISTQKRMCINSATVRMLLLCVSPTNVDEIKLIVLLKASTYLLSCFLLHLSIIEREMFKSSIIIIYLFLFSFLSISASYNLKSIFMCIHILDCYAIW